MSVRFFDATPFVSPLGRVHAEFMRSADPFIIRNFDDQGNLIGTVLPFHKIEGEGVAGGVYSVPENNTYIRVTDLVRAGNGRRRMSFKGTVNYSADAYGVRFAYVYLLILDRRFNTDVFEVDGQIYEFEAENPLGRYINQTSYARGVSPANMGQSADAVFQADLITIPESDWNENYDYYFVIAGSQSSPIDLQLRNAIITIEFYRSLTE